MAKYKVGDRVKAIESVDCKDEIIDVCGTVVAINDRACNPFCVEFDKDIKGHDGKTRGFSGGKRGHCWWCTEDALVALEEPKKEIPYGFKVGDKVRVIKSTTGGKDKWIGTIFTISTLNPNGVNAYKEVHYGVGSSECPFIWLQSELELVEDDKPFPLPIPTPVNVNITVNIDNYANSCWYCRKGGIVDLYLAGRPAICPNCRRMCNNA